VLQRGVGRGVPFSDFPASGAAPSAAGWKVVEEKTVERVPALKHGANSAHCFVKVTLGLEE